MLLGTPGGTVDLRTGDLRPADRADRITKNTSVAPAPEGAQPTAWLRFLAEVFPNDPEMPAFIQRLAGYALMPRASKCGCRASDMQTVARPSSPIAAPSRRGLSRIEAAGYIGVSPSTFDKMVLAGEMPSPKRVGTRRIWDVRALDLAFDALPGENGLSENDSWSDL